MSNTSSKTEMMLWKAKAYFDGIQLMSFDVNDDGASQGELAVDAGSKDMTKYHKEVMKKFRPKVMTQEKKEEVKEETLAQATAGKQSVICGMKHPNPRNRRKRKKCPKKKKESKKTTMTGKPMNDIVVMPKSKEE